MSITQPFKPHYGTGFIISVTTTLTTYTIPAGDLSVHISNLSAVDIYFYIGTRPVTAKEQGMIVRGNNFLNVSKGYDETTITVSAGGAAQAHVITGNCGI